jgi:cytochrome oxidase assembly protein ShyY1
MWKSGSDISSECHIQFTDVYRFLLRPRWIGFHLLCLAGIVGMAFLSAWQFDRLHQRQDFNDDVRSRSTLEPVDVRTLDDADPSSLAWRSATATGTYLADEQILILNRSQGGRAGLNVVTPLLLEDGRAIAINRGFVALDQTPPPAPPGTITVGGILRGSEQRRSGQAREADGELTEMFRLDLDRLAAQVDPELMRVALLAQVASPADDPMLQSVPLPELGEGSHLSYAIQWIIFAVCVAVGWILAVRRSIRTRARSKPSA